MTTGGISAAATANVQQQAGTAILGKTLDMAKNQGAQLTQLMQAPQKVTDPAMGNAVNILA